ncbi:MAG: hypothetical protein QOH42_2477, partial [Blastocatellia bacterium]|nr:hypothetical protein [Blastocatellia bacterium]
TVNSSTLLMLARIPRRIAAEARGNVVVAVCAQTLTPTLSQKGEGGKLYHYPPVQ